MKLQICCILASIILVKGQMVQLSVEAQASYVNFTCPSKRAIRPCQCTVVPDIPTVQCGGVRSLKTIRAALKGWLRNDPIPYLQIVDARFVGLPSRAFVSVNVSRLEIRDSNLRWVASDAFNGLHSLMILILHNVKLMTFPSESLSHLSSLVSLQLPRNRLSSISYHHLRSANKLKLLSLAENRLTFVERDSFPTTLVSLTLSKNYLRSLNKSVRNLPRLESLSIDDNRLIDVEGELDGLYSLKYLNLARNMIRNLGVSLRQLRNLEFLDLQYNSLHEIGTSLKHLSNLKSLNLSKNRLVHLNAIDFNKLSKLKHLDLAGNSIVFISEAFHPLLSLETLDLSQNLMRNFTFDDVRLLSKLKVLDLNDNRLEYLISGYSSNILQTERLFFARNKIISLGEFLRHFVCLESIDLSFNQLRILKTLDYTVSNNMEYISVSGNPLICDEEQMSVYHELRNRNIEVDGQPQCNIDVMHL
ncbi:leucine-rich repeats and immunoglobulin-like domains protein 1 [Parasteatoda tepidariorum]|uniref:leucine-rich repeats and immunoglobulin-like domains protein 1 n=1 Tax=Parasteatoda tepidariorum TaxID=114398 RepID=UPI001C727024|nr:leucine-rich repeat and death domain-containing protein 1 [Parasteatoda tepidariorum]